MFGDDLAGVLLLHLTLDGIRDKRRVLTLENVVDERQTRSTIRIY